MQLIDTNIGISWSTRYLYSTSSDDNIISIKILAQILNVKQSIALYMTFVYLLIQLNVVKGCPTYAEERKSYIYLHPLQVRVNCSLTPDCWFIQFVDICSINWHKCWVSGQQENTKICCIIPNKVTTFNCLLDQFKSMLQSFVRHDNPIVCSFIPTNITLQLVVMCSTNWCQNYLFLANKPIGIRFQ